MSQRAALFSGSAKKKAYQKNMYSIREMGLILVVIVRLPA